MKKQKYLNDVDKTVKDGWLKIIHPKSVDDISAKAYNYEDHLLVSNYWFL